jgi:hypothetical protein
VLPAERAKGRVGGNVVGDRRAVKWKCANEVPFESLGHVAYTGEPLEAWSESAVGERIDHEIVLR